MTKDTKIVSGSGKRKPPAAGKGRPKGALNKTTTQAKEAIAIAAEKLGGAERLVAWAKEDPKNESVFWASIYTKLVPLDVSGSHNVNIVDRTELLRRAGDEVRGIFGGRPKGDGQRLDGGSLPH